MLTSLALAVAIPVRPNIIMIFSDDHARRAISSYKSDLIKTPNIDRIVAQGIRFDRHYTTNPICGPSRASLLTGKYSHLNGFRDNSSKFDGSQMTFPKLLRSAGYETAVIGKWHLESNPTGFDHWEILPGQGAYYDPDFLTPSGRQKNVGYVSEIVTDKALKWLSAPRTKPFFLLLGHKAPHRSWVPNLNKIGILANKALPEPATLRSTHETLTSAAKTVHMRVDTHMRPAEDLMVGFVPAVLKGEREQTWKTAFAPQDQRYRDQVNQGDLMRANYQRYMQNYLRCVSSVDDSVGQVLDYLEKSGDAKNTIVIYASDQGFFLGENGWYDKRWFYEPSSGTPLIIRNLDRKAKIVRSITSNVDLAPTLLEFAGVHPPSEMQGHSLVPEMAGKPNPASAAYGHFYESDDGDHNAPKYVSLVTARYKVIYYYELGEWELFDLPSDPNEQTNLWRKASMGKVRSEMVRKLIQRAKELREPSDLVSSIQQNVRLRG